MPQNIVAKGRILSVVKHIGSGGLEVTPHDTWTSGYNVQMVNIMSGKIDLATKIAGEDITADVIKVVVMSGLADKPVKISGQAIKISGQAVVVSGQTVKISGQTIQIAGGVNVSGQAVKISGQTVQIAGGVNVSGQAVKVSGQTVQIAGGVSVSGQPVRISGQAVVISGQPIKAATETVRKVLMPTSTETGLIETEPVDTSLYNEAYIHVDITAFDRTTGDELLELDAEVSHDGTSWVHRQSVVDEIYAGDNTSVSGDADRGKIKATGDYIVFIRGGLGKYLRMNGGLEGTTPSATLSIIGSFR